MTPIVNRQTGSTRLGIRRPSVLAHSLSAFRRVATMCVVLATLASPAPAQTSDGSDGALNVSGTVTLDLNTRPDGTFNFTTITVNAGALLKFARNTTTNTPARLLATGSVVIDGTIAVSASNFELGSPTGGPGGADGGSAGLAFTNGGEGSGLSPGQGGAAGSPNPGHAGGGGGMATAGAAATRYSAASPAAGGGAIAYPSFLIGGSGGGGGGGWNLFGVPLDGGLGGGAGGAILVATPGDITIGATGQILANGAWGGTSFANIFGFGGPGGGGSGGIIELRGNVITLDVGGMLQAKGGPGGGISTLSIFNPNFSSEANGGHGFARIIGSALHLDGTIDAVQVLGVVSRPDHFMCYSAKTTAHTVAFTPIPAVRLADQFEDKDFEVSKVDQLCNPADKNSEGITDADTHLEGYQIKEVKRSCIGSAPANAGRACSSDADCGGGASTCQSTPKHVPRRGLKVLNQFHAPGSELSLDTVKPVALLVPTAIDPDNPVPNPPDPGTHVVNHYKCYTVKRSNGAEQFDPILGVQVQDQFTADPKVYTLQKPTRLCTPVDKEGEGIKDASVHLLCYQAKPVKGLCAVGAPSDVGGACSRESDCGGTKGVTTYCQFQPKYQATTGVYVNNQFGAGQVDAVKEEELCVPSAKIVP